MRYQGKISAWNDDKGFGFVVQNGGGDKAFVHIKAFSHRSARPAVGDLITYELATDDKGGKRAEKIRFAGEFAPPPRPSSPSFFGLAFAVLFCSGLIAAVATGRLPFVALVVYLTACLITFLAYAVDKAAALQKKWRMQENTLHILSLAGGWPGALLAQRMFRHKTKKETFQGMFWVTVFVNCATLFWLSTDAGAAFVRSALLK